jgi:hypothetical protein
VELFEQIRRDRRLEQLSIRELAERHGVHRRTVRQALDSAVPPPRKQYARRPRPALDAWVAVIDGWLLADRNAPRKQRHTARRVWQRLVAEHGARLAEVTVSRYVAQRRRELGLADIEVTIPQTHLPGAEAEVDFGEFRYASEFVHQDRVLIPSHLEGKLIILQEVSDHASPSPDPVCGAQAEAAARAE